MTERVEIRTIEEAIAWGDSWMAACNELQGRYFRLCIAYDDLKFREELRSEIERHEQALAAHQKWAA